MVDMATFKRELKEIARATIDVARETNDVAHTIQDLKCFGRTHDPDAKMSPAALGAIAVLLHRDLFSSFDMYLEQTIEYAREIAHHYEVRVTSAVRLHEAECTHLKKTLEEKLNGSVALETHVDIQLLGGFMVEMDGWRFDASVNGRMNRLESRMKNAV